MRYLVNHWFSQKTKRKKVYSQFDKSFMHIQKYIENRKRERGQNVITLTHRLLVVVALFLFLSSSKFCIPCSCLNRGCSGGSIHFFTRFLLFHCCHFLQPLFHINSFYLFCFLRFNSFLCYITNLCSIGMVIGFFSFFL